MLHRLFLIIILMTFFYSCQYNEEQLREGKAKVDALFVKIENGTALDEFPEKYFPKEHGKYIMDDLKNKCDFKNRKGEFVQSFNAINASNEKCISYVYDFKLKCDDIRITFSLRASDFVFVGMNLDAMPE